MLAAPLVAAVSAAAPAAQLDLRPSGTLDILERLDHGDLDLAIGNFREMGERFATARLLEDSFVAVMRRGNPAARRALSDERFAALPHLAISSSSDDTGFIDRSLAARHLKRRIVLRAPYLSAGAILARSTMVATLSRRIAEQFVRTNPLRLSELPFRSPATETVMLWHRKRDGQAAHRWLRGAVVSVSKRL